MSEPKRILAVEDEPTQRAVICRVLAQAGYLVEQACEGEEALAKIRERAPDLLICDVHMPRMGGFELLERLRGDAATARLPAILLTAMEDRESIRAGLRLGADDYLVKPVVHEELVAAAGRALDKQQRLSELMSRSALPRHDELQQLYLRKLQRDDSDVAPAPPGAEATGRLVLQTVLFSDIRGFTGISERLPAPEIAELLKRYMQQACEPIIQERGRIMKLMGDGLMAAFGLETLEEPRAQASAALRAGFRIVEVAREFRTWLHSRFDLGGLPEFQAGVGIHSGMVMLFRMNAGGLGDLTIVGDTVNVASRLEAKSKELGWPLVASMATIEAAGPEFAVIEKREMELPGRSGRIWVGRLRVPGAESEPAQPQERVALPTGMQALLNENALTTAAAAKSALDRTLQAIGDRVGEERRAAHEDPAIRGYRVLAKIGEGGMSTVFIAEQEGVGRKAVLKVLKARRTDDENLWKRFFQECAILSSIDHEHVVRIYDQGFGDEMAYLAMEYLAGGTLRQVIDRGLSKRQALSLLSQAASGLAEIHRRGIVHRDIKPANLMLRSEGVLVLTDFGVAKRLGQASGNTLHGEILGTPYYLSPEQAEGGAIAPSADLYSLGVIFYEMLTRRLPFRGETISEILSQHMVAEIPRLPTELTEFQPLLDGMLAKRPADRFRDGDEVLEAIDRVWTSQVNRKALDEPSGG